VQSNLALSGRFLELKCDLIFRWNRMAEGEERRQNQNPKMPGAFHGVWFDLNPLSGIVNINLVLRASFTRDDIFGTIKSKHNYSGQPYGL
jgi:hypothetical protein